MAKTSILRIALFFICVCLQSCENAVPQHETVDQHNKNKSKKYVETLVVKPQTLRVYEHGTATVESRRKAHLSFKSSGNVVYIKTRSSRQLREGDIVRRGDVLAKLDSETARINQESQKIKVAQARLHVVDKKAALERAKRLYQAGAIAEKILNEHQVSYKNALLELDAANVDYKQAANSQKERALVAPFSGVIAAMNLREGQRVTPVTSSTLHTRSVSSIPITIIDPSRFKATAQVPFSIGSKIKTGQNAYLSYESSPVHNDANARDISHAIPAQVVATGLSINPNDRTLRIRLRPNSAYNSYMIDGSQVSVWFEVVNKPDSVIVPLSAIQTDNNVNAVFVVDKQHAVKKTVQLGQMTEGGVEVLAGLEMGDVVVTKGVSQLSHDTPVTVMRQKHEDNMHEQTVSEHVS